MADPMTNLRFAVAAMGIAREAQAWAGDTLTGYHPDRLSEPMREEAARRFVAKIRERLGWIEEEFPTPPTGAPA